MLTRNPDAHELGDVDFLAMQHVWNTNDITVFHDGTILLRQQLNTHEEWNTILLRMGKRLAEITKELQPRYVAATMSCSTRKTMCLKELQTSSAKLIKEKKKESERQHERINVAKIQLELNEVKAKNKELLVEINNLKILNVKLVNRIHELELELKKAKLESLEWRSKYYALERTMHETIRSEVEKAVANIKDCFTKLHEDNERLREENKQLREENKQLREENKQLFEENKRLFEENKRILARLDKYDAEKALVEARIFIAQWISKGKSSLVRYLGCESMFDVNRKKTIKEISEAVTLLFGVTHAEWTTINELSDPRNKYCHPKILSTPQETLDNALIVLDYEPVVHSLISNFITKVKGLHTSSTHMTHKAT